MVRTDDNGHEMWREGRPSALTGGGGGGRGGPGGAESTAAGRAAGATLWPAQAGAGADGERHSAWVVRRARGTKERGEVVTKRKGGWAGGEKGRAGEREAPGESKGAQTKGAARRQRACGAAETRPPRRRGRWRGQREPRPERASRAWDAARRARRDARRGRLVFSLPSSLLALNSSVIDWPCVLFSPRAAGAEGRLISIFSAAAARSGCSCSRPPRRPKNVPLAWQEMRAESGIRICQVRSTEIF